MNFGEKDYAINEGETLESGFTLELRSIQNPVTITIYPVSLTNAVNNFDFNATDFLPMIGEVVDAMEGKSFYY